MTVTGFFCRRKSFLLVFCVSLGLFYSFLSLARGILNPRFCHLRIAAIFFRHSCFLKDLPPLPNICIVHYLYSMWLMFHVPFTILDGCYGIVVNWILKDPHCCSWSPLYKLYQHDFILGLLHSQTFPFPIYVIPLLSTIMKFTANYPNFIVTGLLPPFPSSLYNTFIEFMCSSPYREFEWHHSQFQSGYIPWLQEISNFTLLHYETGWILERRFSEAENTEAGALQV